MIRALPVLLVGAVLTACGQGQNRPEANRTIDAPPVLFPASEAEYWSAVFDYTLGIPGELSYSHMSETVGPQSSPVRCNIRRAEHMEDLITDGARHILSKCVRADHTGKPLS